MKKVPQEIISCDISSGRTYFTGKLYYISSTDVKLPGEINCRVVKKVPSFLTWWNKFHNCEIDFTDAWKSWIVFISKWVEIKFLLMLKFTENRMTILTLMYNLVKLTSNYFLRERPTLLCSSYHSVMKLSRVGTRFFSLLNYRTSVAQTSDTLNKFWQSLRVRASEVLLYL